VMLAVLPHLVTEGQGGERFRWDSYKSIFRSVLLQQYTIIWALCQVNII